MNKHLSIREMVLFAFFGALMFTSKQILEFLPNVHMLGMFTMLFAIVYRGKGIIPVIVFILLEGAYTGFGIWWVPYWYLWPILFLIALTLPRKMPPKIAVPVYMIVCALHGLCYGTLYAPFQAIAFGLSLKGTLAWIASGFPWDCVHAAGNFCFGALVYPLSRLLLKLENSANNGYY